VFLKCENFQRIGAFKMRGATNLMRQLTAEEAARGVVTHSSGNHAQAVALAGRLLGIRATVVMPENAPAVKREATIGYGATVVPCKATQADREATVARIQAETGATLVHPYDDPRIVAGQGTAARELLEDASDLDLVLAPVGGGGLLSGTAVACRGRAEVVGSEPAGADDASRSLSSGVRVTSQTPKTVCDGLLTCLGAVPFAILKALSVRIVTVPDDEILAALRFVLERTKLVIEPSSAVPVAALLSGRVPVRGRRVAVILSGGNLDVSPLFPGQGAR
jgi:threonine dehydratase